jgi:hypothetical protein
VPARTPARACSLEATLELQRKVSQGFCRRSSRLAGLTLVVTGFVP